MSENNDNKALQDLIVAFNAYRNVLVPLQESLKVVVENYGEIKESIAKLDKIFSPDAKSQLDKITVTLNNQAKSGRELFQRIDDFSLISERYVKAVNDMTTRFSLIEARLSSLDELEKIAENQLSRLESIINEKKISYNVKDLQKALDSYNKNVEKISEFINKDVANVLQENGRKVDDIKQENEQLFATIKEQNQTIAELVSSFHETSAIIKQTVERDSVNEAYLFDAFDRWATSRKVKIKKKDD